MVYWVIAIAVQCVSPAIGGKIEPCLMIQNSYLGGHEKFLTKEECLKEVGSSTRLSCIAMHSPQP